MDNVFFLGIYGFRVWQNREKKKKILQEVKRGLYR